MRVEGPAMKPHSFFRGSRPPTHGNCAKLQSARFQRQKCHARLRCSASKSRSGASVMIKICGVTTAEDAKLAADAGADYVGMIMWPRAKRSVEDETAREIADAARRSGAEPVGVFVDEDAATITRRCQAVGLRTAQLHGAACRSELDAIPDDLDVVFVLHARPDGELASELPRTGGRRRGVQWALIDGLKGGSGEAFDWSALEPPEGLAASGWLLAGGLHPGNVAEAIRTAAPTAVDVSSGVCGPDGLRKDPERIKAFVDAVRAAGREERGQRR